MKLIRLEAAPPGSIGTILSGHRHRHRHGHGVTTRGGPRTGSEGMLGSPMPDLRRRAVRESLTVRLDASGMLHDAIGAAGLTHGEIDALAERAAEVTHALQARRAAGELPVFDLPQRTEMVREITALARQVRDEVDTLVVLGIGGAALGSRAIVEALADGTTRVEVADNVDPWRVGTPLDWPDPPPP